MPDPYRAHADAAEKLWHLTGEPTLSAAQRAVVDEMLSINHENTWRHFVYWVDSAHEPAFRLRALYGLYILDEDVIWAERRLADARTAYDMLIRVITAAPGIRAATVSTRAANGEQEIRAANGRCIKFRSSGLNGYAAGCWLINGPIPDAVLPMAAVAANAQIIHTR